MARSRRSPFISQAAAESLVRFGPETSGLRELQRQQEAIYRTRLRQASGTARAITHAVDAAVPDVAGIYDRSGLDAARVGQTLLHGDLAGLGDVANTLKAAGAIEAAGMAGRLTEARAQSLGDLQTRKVQAQMGRKFATEQATNEFVDELSKILRRRQDLRRERGAFEQARIGELTEAQRGRQLQKDIARMGIEARADEGRKNRATKRAVAGVDAQGNKLPGRKAGGKTTRYGTKLASPEKHLEYQSAIQEIRNHAEKFKRQGQSRRDAVEKLKKGRPQQKITHDPDTGAKLPQPLTLPAIPQFKPDIRMTAALDLAYDGHLSRKTQQQLQRQFSLRQLAVGPTYRDWLRKGGQKRATREQARQIAQALGGL